MSTAERAGRPRVAFLHDPEDLQLDALGSADTVIALTPEAWEAAVRVGAHVVVIDDLVDREPDVDEIYSYLRWQLDWVRRFDEAADSNGAITVAALLLTWPVDAVVGIGRMLRLASDALRPAHIMYIGSGGPEEPDPWHLGHLQFWPRLGDLPLAARLLPLIAAEADASFEAITFDRPPVSHEPGHHGIGGGARHTLAALRNRFPRRLPGRARDTSVVLWSTGYGARDVIAAEQRDRHAVLALQRGAPQTRLEHLWGGAASRDIPVAVPPSPVSGEEPALGETLETLLREVDSWAGIRGAGTVLRRRMRCLVDRVAPVIDRAAGELGQSLGNNDVHRMLGTNPSSIEEWAALLAASQKGGVRRVLFQHGDYLMPYGSWLVNETGPFDEMHVSDRTLLTDLPDAARRLGAQAPEIVLHSPRVAALERKAVHARRAAALWGAVSRAARRPTVCYVPLFFIGDSAGFGAGFYDDAWYHRWHLRLLDAMAAAPTVDFVWKGLPSIDEVPDPIPAMLARGRAPNVRYEARPFTRVLGAVDRVIVDFPSTALYETVAFEKPLLALVFERFTAVRENAAKAFEPVLRLPRNEDEALAYIAEFLAADPSTWVLDRSRLLP